MCFDCGLVFGLTFWYLRLVVSLVLIVPLFWVDWWLAGPGFSVADWWCGVWTAGLCLV